jgi:hypothetical protein
LKVHCNKCGDYTAHDILWQCVRSVEFTNARERDLAAPVYTRERDSVLSCKGCETASFLQEFEYIFREEKDDISEPFQPEPEFSEVHPPRFSHASPARWELPGWWVSIPDDDVKELMKEVYTALSIDLGRLALMGVRALLERMMTKAVGDKGTFKATLAAYKDHVGLGVMSEDALKTVVEVGNATIHRAFKIESEHLDKIMDTMEHILREAYVLPNTVGTIAGRTPSRPHRSRPTG